MVTVGCVLRGRGDARVTAIVRNYVFYVSSDGIERIACLDLLNARIASGELTVA